MRPQINPTDYNIEKDRFAWMMEGNDDVGAMYSARTVVSDCKWGDGATMVGAQ